MKEWLVLLEDLRFHRLGVSLMGAGDPGATWGGGGVCSPAPASLHRPRVRQLPSPACAAAAGPGDGL